MVKFTLKHIKGVNFPPGGLSRREAQPGDEVWSNGDDDRGIHGPPGNHSDWDYFTEQPLDLDEFKEEIDA
jgi:hypothetical protein